MSIQRVFLGHHQPALLAAAEFLFARCENGGVADLRRFLVVVPGSRAGRRLLEILVEVAAQRQLTLTPPSIETVGKLPEHLYRPKRPFAPELVQRLVWAETLRQAPAESLIPVVPIPPGGDAIRWLPLADLLRRQHMELAADGLAFADVARLGGTIDGFREQPRWQALQYLQEDFLRRLDALELWDLQTARLKAIEFHECQTDRDVVLLGAVDLNVTMRKMLDQVADRVTALIFASENWQSRFDQHGCLIPADWEQVELPIVSDDIEVAERPAEQAELVAQHLAAFNGRYRADEIVIGIPDEQLIPDVERRLAMAGATARWGPGEPFDRTPPIRLLRAIADYLEEQQYPEFAALVRHPDIEPWLVAASLRDAGPGVTSGPASRRDAATLEQLDEYQNQQLPFQLPNEFSNLKAGSDGVLRIAASVAQLLGELPKGTRSLADWIGPLWRVITEVYGQRPLQVSAHADGVILAVCNSVRGALQQLAQMPTTVMPRLTASNAIRFLLDELRNSTIPAPTTADSIEMLGWLELPLDDAPALIVTSFNEGFVPESLNSDLFLPDALRRRLGLLDNSRRYARDAYAVSVIAATRQTVHWIVGRRNHDGDPLAPSRLLFACDRETAAKRALRLFRSASVAASLRDAGPNATQGPAYWRDAATLAVPRPQPLKKPVDRLNVTAFRDYLACPYRFYLRHILRLEEISDELDELDGAAFGSLAHEVLRRFGTSTSRDSTSADEIRQVLDTELDQYASEAFGPNPLPAVLVQIEQLRWRLRAFADHQAAWREQGWQIEFIESPANWEDAAVLNVDGRPIQISGRIDRIDMNVDTGERVILDYKTSDTGRSPESTHRRNRAWIDLQLPLYRHMAATLGITGPLRLGYIVLSKDTTATQFVLAEWSSDELASADELAWNVVRRIRREEFWPPADPPPDFAEEFAPICQDGIVKG